MSRRKLRSILFTILVLGLTLLYVSNISWLFKFSLPFKNVDLENVPIVPVASVDSIVPIVKTTDKDEANQQIQKPDQSTEKGNSYLDDAKEVFDFDEESTKEMEFNSKTTAQSMILSYWSSGATFFGEILDSVPDTHYNYEPLVHFGMKKIRNSSDVTTAINTIRQMLQCNFMGLNDYFHADSYEFVVQHNSRLWNSCQFNTSFCWNPVFVGTFCQMMPRQIIKEVRLLAEHSELLLVDPELEVKIVLLIRDPRAIMHSRKMNNWCKGNPDCENVSNLCNDMVADFGAAQMLIENYPDRFTVLRYEDLLMDPFNTTKSILKFYGLPFHEHVKQFLDARTGIERENEMSTYQWAKEMDISEMQSIQSECSKAISLWGYKQVSQEDILNRADVEPLLESLKAIKTLTPKST